MGSRLFGHNRYKGAVWCSAVAPSIQAHNFFLLLSVLSLFLSLLATKGGLKAGNIIISLIGLVLVFSNQDLYIVFISLSLIINGLLNAIFDSDKTKIAGTIKTTSLFYLLSILFFFLFFEHLLIAL